MKNKNTLKILIILLFVIFSIFSCNKKQAYIFEYKEYFSVFDEAVKIHKIIIKIFNRNFFDVKEIRVNSFTSIKSELDVIKQTTGKGLIFLDEHLSSLLIKNITLPEEHDLKLVTYNIPQTDIYITPELPVFNVTIDQNVIAKRLLNVLKRNSKDKENLSDCGIMINPDQSLANEVVKWFKAKGYDIDVFEIYDEKNKNEIKKWITKNKKKVIVFFAYKINKYILELRKNNLPELTYIEVITNYSKLSDMVKYRLSINWENAIKYALGSNDFRKFYNSKKIEEKEEIENFLVSLDNTITIKKIKKKKIVQSRKEKRSKELLKEAEEKAKKDLTDDIIDDASDDTSDDKEIKNKSNNEKKKNKRNENPKKTGMDKKTSF